MIDYEEYWQKAYDDGYSQAVADLKQAHKPQTNANRIRQMSDEELAYTADAVLVVRCKDCKWWCPDNRPEWKPNAPDEVKKAALTERYYEGVKVWGNGNLCLKHLPSDQHEAINFEANEFCNFGERKEK